MELKPIPAAKQSLESIWPSLGHSLPSMDLQASRDQQRLHTEFICDTLLQQSQETYTNDSKDTSEDMWGETKAAKTGKFIALKAFSGKEDRLQFYGPRAHLKAERVYLSKSSQRKIQGRKWWRTEISRTEKKMCHRGKSARIIYTSCSHFKLWNNMDLFCSA